MTVDLSMFDDRTNMEKAVRRMVFTDMTQMAIAKELGLANGTVSSYKTKPKYEEIRKEMQEQKYQMERDQIGHLVPEAIETYAALLKSNNDNIRYAAARDILDRTGHKAVEKKETTLKGSVDISERAKLVEKYLKDEVEADGNVS